MKLGANLREKQSWQKELNAYFRDCFARIAVQELPTCRQTTVEDNQKDTETCLDGSKEGGEEARGCHDCLLPDF